MAFTVSAVTDSVMGKWRMKVLNITPDDTTGTVDMNTYGMSKVVWALNSPVSMVTMSGNSRPIGVFHYNQGALGTAIVAMLSYTGVVANDVYQTVVFGPS